MIPGMWGNAEQMALLARQANSQGFSVAALSLRHHWGVIEDGGKAPGQTSIHDLVEDVSGVISSAFNQEPVIVVGHSLGGLIAQCLLDHALVKGAVLLASAAPKGTMSINPSLIPGVLKNLPWLLLGKPITKPKNTLRLLFSGNKAAMEEVEKAGGLTTWESGQAIKEQVFGLIEVKPSQKPVLVLVNCNDRSTDPIAQEKIARWHTEPVIVGRKPLHHMFHTVDEGASWATFYMAKWVESHKLSNTAATV